MRRASVEFVPQNGFIPTYAAFNLIGDADMRGREMLMALTGLNSRGYKNSTLLFNLARVFIARSPARALINPPWKGIAEPMWEPMQIRHRSAYYDAFFTEALLSFAETGLASPDEATASRRAIADMVEFCLTTSREDVRAQDGSLSASSPRWRRCRIRGFQNSSRRSSRTSASASTCRIATPPPARSRRRPRPARPIRSSTSRCWISMPATRWREGANEPVSRCRSTTTSITRAASSPGSTISAGERPFGNDLDPTLNLDILEVSFRNLARWKILRDPGAARDRSPHHRLSETAGASGAFTNPRSHIYYLPELYCAYFGRCYAAFIALPPAAQAAIDPDGAFDFIRSRVLAYVQDELIAHEMNAFDAALALIALGHLGADAASFRAGAALHRREFGEGGRHGPFKAYEWNKMKTPTRILVGGPEVTSAFVLMGLALARRAMMAGRRSVGKVARFAGVLTIRSSER